MPITMSDRFARPAKTAVHRQDPIAVERPRSEQPLPLDKRIRLDARIRAECIEVVAIGDLKPNPRNAKKHPEQQIALLQKNFETFGFTTPLLVDEKTEIIAGHARYLAAQRSGFEHLPVIRLSHLKPAEKRAAAIADNKLSELGKWDPNILAGELSFIFNDPTIEFEPLVIGFDTREVEQIIGAGDREERVDPADVFEPAQPRGAAVTRAGDVWMCEQHRLLCADATVAESYAALMGRDKADVVFTSCCPMNLSNEAPASEREGVGELALVAGKMSSSEYIALLTTVFNSMLAYMQAGATGFFCTDWRHLRELWTAADPVFGRMKDLITWVKTNPTDGGFYRSQHELICVYVAPGRPNFGLQAELADAPMCGNIPRSQVRVWSRRLIGRVSRRQTRSDGGGCPQRLLQPWRDRARCICGIRHHDDCGRARQATGTADGGRAASLRCHRSTLAEPYWQECKARRDQREF